MAGRFVENAVKVAEKCHLVTPRIISSVRHYCKFKRWPDIDHPRTINEKVLYLLFNTDTSEWTRLADKLEVRKFVESRGLAHTLPRIYAVGSSSADIDWDSLPDQFVVKTNHGCGTVHLVRDKASEDLNALRRTVDRWLATPFGYATAEPHYTRIPPRVYVEELLPCEPGTQPNDYKFWCFDGKVYGCLLCTCRDSDTHTAKYNWVDLPSWTYRPEVMPPYSRNSHRIPRPDCLNEMMEVAGRLSEGFPEVRVDLYCIGDKVYFGELTFTSNGGRDGYTPDHLITLGNQVKIPDIKS